MKSDLEEMKSLHYNHKAVEDKWRSIWQDKQIDVADIALNASGKGKKPFYNLMMFPYPSAEGLHVGNMYAFTGTDILGRFKRMQGYEVFEPIGLDGFGIHSENFALKIGRHPMDHAKITEKNYYNQLHRIGAMYDWNRTVQTYDPDYYRWTQWLFVQMFEHGLAYRGKAHVNWCPSCKTVLADEQVIDGVCERCGSSVEKKLLEQWFFRITAYAEKLLQNTFSLNWTEKILVAQRNWIGKSIGLNIDFKVSTLDKPITIWTKYWETIFGTTFIVLSPKHWAIERLNIPESYRKEVERYIHTSNEDPASSAGGSSINREGIKESSRQARTIHSEDKEKTGVFTGAYAKNPANGEDIPIWIADYVLAHVGTGAVMGVPSHDPRDFAFAKKYNIPITQVVKYKDIDIDSKVSKLEMPYEGEGELIHSGAFNGMDAWGEGKVKMAEWMKEQGFAQEKIIYHLRDWLISRQRYWGPPIPMIFCKACAKEGKSWFTSSLSSSGLTRGSNSTPDPRLREDDSMPGWYPVPEEQLPVILPRIEDYKPGDDGIAPLAKHKEFYETKCPGCGGDAVRETDVSDTFLDSSWYFLRYPSVSKTAEVGNKNFDSSSNSLADISPSRPSVASRSQGESEQNFVSSPQGSLPWDPTITRTWLPVEMYTGGAEHSVLHLMYSRFVTMALHDWKFITFDEPFPHFFAHGLIIKDGAKMSKSKGNVVNPDEYIDRYGADALRLYLMFTGPYGQGGDFRDSAMEGTYRWINRIWRITQAALTPSTNSRLSLKEPQGLALSDKVVRALHRLVKKVGEDIERRSYNTAIASMMEFTNLVTDQGGRLDVESLKIFLKLLAPFAPYMTEELWQQTYGMSSSRRRGSSLVELDPRVKREDDGGFNSIHLQSWPSFDPAALVDDTVEIVIQVNGKVRDKIVVDRKMASDKEKLAELAQRSDKVLKLATDKAIIKTIVVPGRLVNIVI